MGEKPLNVRVAEALGWRHFSLWVDQCDGEATTETWIGIPSPVGASEPIEVPRFDTDWSATGPLIERFRLTVWSHSPADESVGMKGWYCNGSYPGIQVTSGYGLTPLLATCHYILALHAAGKLRGDEGEGVSR